MCSKLLLQIMFQLHIVGKSTKLNMLGPLKAGRYALAASATGRRMLPLELYVYIYILIYGCQHCPSDSFIHIRDIFYGCAMHGIIHQ